MGQGRRLIPFEEIETGWDADVSDLMSRIGVRNPASKPRVKMLSRKGLFTIELEFRGFDAFSSDKVQAAKDATMEWLRGYGSVKQVSRGTQGVLIVMLET